MAPAVTLVMSPSPVPSRHAARLVAASPSTARPASPSPQPVVPNTLHSWMDDIESLASQIQSEVRIAPAAPASPRASPRVVARAAMAAPAASPLLSPGKVEVAAGGRRRLVAGAAGAVGLPPSLADMFAGAVGGATPSSPALAGRLVDDLASPSQRQVASPRGRAAPKAAVAVQRGAPAAAGPSVAALLAARRVEAAAAIQGVF